MDRPRFDAVLRRAVGPLNRRTGLGALAALAALSLPGPATPARARKRKKRCGCRPACGGDRPFCCNGRCRAECCGDGQCGAGEVCLRGACVVPCPQGTGCPAGPIRAALGPAWTPTPTRSTAEPAARSAPRPAPARTGAAPRAEPDRRHAVPLITLPLETWRAVVAELRIEGLPPYMSEHADRIERALDEHGPGEAKVALFLNEDVYLRSYNHSRLKLGIPLPPPGR